MNINGNNMYTQNMGTNMQNQDGILLKEPVPAPNLITKDITENNTYTAKDDGADGYSSVTVDVAGGGGETFEVEMNLVRTDQSGGTVSTSKSYQETVNAYNDGKTIVFSVTWNGVPREVVCSGCVEESGTVAFVIFCVTDVGAPMIQWLGESNTLVAMQTAAALIMET